MATKVQVYVIGPPPVVVSVTLPDNVNFVAWCKHVKADGGVFSDQMHVPYDRILGIVVEGAIQFNPNPNAPTTETKQ